MKNLLILVFLLSFVGCVDEPTIIDPSTGKEVNVAGDDTQKTQATYNKPATQVILKDSFHVTYEQINGKYVELSRNKPINYELTSTDFKMGNCTFKFKKNPGFNIEDVYSLIYVHGVWENGLYPGHSDRIAMFFNEGEFVGVRIGSKISVVNGEDLTNYIDTSPPEEETSAQVDNKPYIYVVRPGDNWASIADHLGVPLPTLRRWNPTANRLKDNLLPIGTKLRS